MRNRVWYKIVDYVYSSYYLAEFIKVNRKRKKHLNILLTFFSLTGIIGWYKIDDYDKYWAVFLIILQGVRLTISRFMIDDATLNSIENIKNFYQEKVTELEDLWYRMNSDSIKLRTAETTLRKLNQEEMLVQKINRHDKVSRIPSIDKKADVESRMYLNRFK